MLEFGADATITYVMGGLAREFEDPEAMIVPWLDASDRSGMPLDPRLWREAPRWDVPAEVKPGTGSSLRTEL